MIYQDFRNEFIDQVYFTSNQVYVWHPDFDKNNLRRWVNKKYLIKLRNGYYTFRELLDTAGSRKLTGLFIGGYSWAPPTVREWMNASMSATL